MTDHDSTQGTTRALNKLAEWSSKVTWSDVPADVQKRAALILLDDFGAMVAARDEPELIAIRESVARSAGGAEATIFDGGRQKLDRYSAALSNGTAADWCELDGGYRPVVCHAGLYCIPALLAEAEATAARLRDLLLALLVGYETVARVARCFTFPELVLHPHAGLATVGAVAAVAKLRGFTGSQTSEAICTGATLVLPGPFNHAVEGALVRNAWPGLCAQNGLRAADWSLLGVAGTPQSLSDVFADIFSAKSNPVELSDGLGNTWSVRDGYQKMHACCQYGHSVVEAVLAAIGEGEKTTAGDIQAISIETHSKGRKLDNPAPSTTLAAKFSIQHIAAATTVFGHAGSAAFHADTLADPTLSKLREKVSISAFEPEMEWPNDRPARVVLTLRDGGVLQGECLSARGGLDRPFTDEEIADKAARNLRDGYPKAFVVLGKMQLLEPQLLDQSWPAIIETFC